MIAQVVYCTILRFHSLGEGLLQQAVQFTVCIPLKGMGEGLGVVLR